MKHVDAISEQEKVQEKFHSETVSVLLAIPLDIPFDYSLPTGIKLATGSIVRVLIESTDGEQTWTTVGSSENIIEASWIALSDSLEWWLLKRKGNF